MMPRKRTFSTQEQSTGSIKVDMVNTYRFEIEVQVSGKQLFPSPQRQQSERTQQHRYQHGQKAQNCLFE